MNCASDLQPLQVNKRARKCKLLINNESQFSDCNWLQVSRSNFDRESRSRFGNWTGEVDVIRDMDVIRAMVLASAASNTPLHGVEGVSEGDFAAHAELLDEAGLAKCLIGYNNESGPTIADDAVVLRLTWSGFDFAQSIIDDTVWNRVKDDVLRPAGSWTFEVLLEYLKRAALSGLGMD